MRRLFNDVVIRGALEVREEYIARRRLEERGRAGPSTNAAGPAEEARACISFDGEAQFLNAAMEHFVDDMRHDGPDCLLRKLICIKYAAACSKTQQPADVSPTFMMLKAKLAHLMAQHPEGVTRMYMDRVQRLLQTLDNTSAFLFKRWISLMETALSDVFTESNVVEGWQINGLVPLDHKKLLSMCYGVEDLSDKQMAACCAAIKKLAPSILRDGQVKDREIQAAVGGALQLNQRDVCDERGRKVRKELHEMAIQRRRTIILTASKIIDEFKVKRGVPIMEESEADKSVSNSVTD